MYAKQTFRALKEKNKKKCDQVFSAPTGYNTSSIKKIGKPIESIGVNYYQ